VNDDMRYWTQLLAGGINLLLWFIVVIALAIVTLARARWSALGKLAFWTAVCFTAFAVAWAAFMISYPPWYRAIEDQIIRLAVVAIMVSYYITLMSCIAVFQATPEARRLTLKMGAITGVGALGLTLSQVYLDGWEKIGGEILSGVLFMGAIWFACQAQARLRNNPPGGTPG
jgi:hypothetical protein